MQYGLIGEHLSHSYSKQIHEQIAGYEYVIREIPPADLPEFLKKREFKAINVTIPYKQDVIAFLDGISERAEQIGAVNTIVNTAGRLKGYNTDFDGMNALLKKTGISAAGKKALILGTGGTSKTAKAVLMSNGAKEIYKVSRKKDPGSGVITYEEAAKQHRDVQLIINTTPCGMFPDTKNRPLNISDFPELEGVIDAVYNPLRTQLVLDAQEKGIKAEGGLYMLSAQAVYASALFTGSEAKEEDIARAYKAVLSQKENIVLCGMPSCGKTTVGGMIAGILGKDFADTDDMIVDRAGREIKDIFASSGEEAFRDMETEAVKAAAMKENTVIAIGGGAVLRPGNVRALKMTGTLIFIDRPLKELITTDSRPLSSNRSALEDLYEKRYGIYTSCADMIIDGSGTADEVAERTVKEIRAKI